jgi:hypothetical protein
MPPDTHGPICPGADRLRRPGGHQLLALLVVVSIEHFKRTKEGSMVPSRDAESYPTGITRLDMSVKFGCFRFGQ